MQLRSQSSFKGLRPMSAGVIPQTYTSGGGLHAPRNNFGVIRGYAEMPPPTFSSDARALNMMESILLQKEQELNYINQLRIKNLDQMIESSARHPV